ncbi:transcription factor KUA1-like [Quercus robur]|uniref:transcription factor KUA1-like n=1 Tax=Quercus robur TaxID=38942 RepID=UPI002163FD2D|nr:transcription factor KUA1-like [Quercus robur]
MVMRDSLSVRKCLHCGLNVHNSSGIATGKCVKLFAVCLRNNGDDHDQDAMKNRVSMENPCYEKVESKDGEEDDAKDLANGINQRRRWTEEEHKLFLIGLKKLGRGDWKGVSSNFVITRSPAQVASHAQKHFMRQLEVAPNDSPISHTEKSDTEKAVKATTAYQHNENRFPHIAMGIPPLAQMPPPVFGDPNCCRIPSTVNSANQSYSSRLPGRTLLNYGTCAPDLIEPSKYPIFHHHRRSSHTVIILD